MASEFQSAMTIRSLRILKNELEFLADSAVIKPDQLNAILAQLPTETDARAAAARQNQTPPSPLQVQPLPQPVQAQPPPAPYSPPVTQASNLSLNEKAPSYNSYASPPPQAPPAYPQVPPSLGFASAMWAYTPTDAGDLALAQNDRIVVLEHMNDDWWRGRNERTGQEGIFPKSYVTPIDNKGGITSPPPPTNYGNMPLAVSQSGSAPNTNDPEQKSKFEQNGKKFGKKLGNAAIFGAGATVGSNIVNSIF